VLVAALTSRTRSFALERLSGDRPVGSAKCESSSPACALWRSSPRRMRPARRGRSAQGVAPRGSPRHQRQMQRGVARHGHARTQVRTDVGSNNLVLRDCQFLVQRQIGLNGNQRRHQLGDRCDRRTACVFFSNSTSSVSWLTTSATDDLRSSGPRNGAGRPVALPKAGRHTDNRPFLARGLNARLARRNIACDALAGDGRGLADAPVPAAVPVRACWPRKRPPAESTRYSNQSSQFRLLLLATSASESRRRYHPSEVHQISPGPIHH